MSLDLTIALNDKYYELNKQNPNTFKAEKQQQEVLELEILKNNKTNCILSNDTELENLDREDVVNRLKSLVNDSFYDNGVMNIMKCFINSIILTNNGYSINERITNYFTNLKQIGAQSANGVALSASLNNENNFFVIKAPQNPDDASALIHECFVGLNGTNSLRAEIPNFAYIYGFVNCSAPIIKNKEVISWCMDSKNANVTYAIYEKINNSISLATYIETCTAEDFMKIYLQILYALKIAERKIGFTHYDLHYENILLRKIDRDNFFIKYDNIYLDSNSYVATIIDYGMSNIKYTVNDVPINFGNMSNLEDLNITNDCNILFDVYKLLMFSLKRFKEKNNSEYNILKSLFLYFNSIDTIDEVIKNEWQSRYAVIIPRTIINFSIDDWINYCLTYMNKNGWENPTGEVNPNIENILQCVGNGSIGCYSNTSLLEYLDVNTDTILPRSYLEIYDLHMILKNNLLKHERLKNLFLENYNTVFLNNEANLLYTLRTFFENYTYIDIEISTDIQAYSENYDLYMKNFYSKIEYLTNFKKSNVYLTIFKNLNTLYNIDIYSEAFVQSTEFLNFLKTINSERVVYDILKSLNTVYKTLLNIKSLFLIKLKELNINTNEYKITKRNYDTLLFFINNVKIGKSTVFQ